MALNFQQTDTAGACAVGTDANRTASVGGTAGVTAAALNIAAAATEQALAFEMIPGAGASWDAGTLVARVNGTLGNSNVTITAVHVYRYSAACGLLETLGSVTGLSLSTTGVVSQNVTLAAATSPGDTDKLIVAFTYTNAHSHSAQAPEITPNQIIDTPFNVSVSRSISEGIEFGYSLGAEGSGIEGPAESVVLGDSFSQSTAVNADRSISEGLVFGYSLGGTATVVFPGEAVNYGDSFVADTSVPRSTADTVEFSDSFSAELTATVAVSEGLAFGYSLGAEGSGIEGPDNNILLGDTFAQETSAPGAESLTEGVLHGDSFAAAVSATGAFSDGLVVGYEMGYTADLEIPDDSIVFGDSFARTVSGETNNTSDGVVFSDVFAAAVDAPLSLTEGALFGYSLGGTATLVFPGEAVNYGDSFAQTTSAPGTETVTNGTLLGDTFAAAVDAASSIAEGVHLGYSIGIEAELDFADEALVLGDSFAGSTAGQVSRTTSDVVEFSDTFSAVVNTAASVSDGLVFADSFAAQSSAAPSVTDGLVLSDAFTVQITVAASTTEGITFSDTPVASTEDEQQRALTEGLLLSDAHTAAVTTNEAVTDVVEYGDVVAGLVNALGAVGEGISVGDSFTAQIQEQQARSITDGSIFADSWLAETASSAVVLDGSTLGDSYAPVVVAANAFADALELGDGFVASTEDNQQRTLSEGWLAGDDLAVAAGISVDEAVALGDSFAALVTVAGGVTESRLFGSAWVPEYIDVGAILIGLRLSFADTTTRLDFEDTKTNLEYESS